MVIIVINDAIISAIDRYTRPHTGCVPETKPIGVPSIITLAV